MRFRVVRAMAMVLCGAAIVGLASGCFVMDELDQSSKEASRYSHGNERNPAKAAPAATSASTSTASAAPAAPAPNAAANWWKKARSLGPETTDATIGRCDFHGRIEFAREADCRSRGGRPLGQ